MANKYASLITLAVTAMKSQNKADSDFLTLLEGVKSASIKPEDLKEFLVPAIAKLAGLQVTRPETGRTAGQIGFAGDEKECANARATLKRWGDRIKLSLGWIEPGSGNNQTDAATKLYNSIAKMDGRSRAKLVRLMKEQGWV